MLLVVPDTIGSAVNITEEKISEKAFELIFAFDEVITFGGYKESINLQQIRTNLEMESHEEKLHNMIKLSKMESARDQARDAAKSIREKKREEQRMGISGGSSMSSMSSNYSSGGSSDSMPYTVPVTPTSVTTPSVSTASSKTSRGIVKGMSLSTSNKSKSLEDALVKEDKLAPIASSRTAHEDSAAVAAAAMAASQQFPIVVLIQEKVSASISRDGVVNSFDIKGSLSVTASTEDAALNTIQLSMGACDSFSFNTHPKINKAAFDKSSIVQLKDTTKGFPVGRPVGVLKWSLLNGNEHLLPLKINCWPEDESRGQMNVTIDFSLENSDCVLHNVRIRIPLMTKDVPKMLSIDGNYKVNSQDMELIWEVDMIDRSNPSGNMEFTILQKNADVFFPISVEFSSNHLVCPVEVSGVIGAQDGRPIMYSLSKGMMAEEYNIN